MASTTLSVIGSLLVLQTATRDSLGGPPATHHYVGNSRQCTNEAISLIWSSLPPCQPRSTLARLPLPDDADVVEVIPSHAEVPRCAGVCHQGNVYHHCVPSARGRINKTLEVMFRRLSGQVECSDVVVETHAQCECGCDVLASSCTEKQVRNT